MTRHLNSSSVSSPLIHAEIALGTRGAETWSAEPWYSANSSTNQPRTNSIQIPSWWKPVSLHWHQVYLHQLAQMFPIISRYYSLIWKPLPRWNISYCACAFILALTLCLQTHDSNSRWLPGTYCSIRENKGDLLMLSPPKRPPRAPSHIPVQEPMNRFLLPLKTERRARFILKTHISIVGENY